MCRLILAIYLIWDRLGSRMLQRNSGAAQLLCVCVSLLLLVMRTGSQGRKNLSEDLFTSPRPHYISRKMVQKPI